MSLGYGIRFFQDGGRELWPRPGVRFVAVTDLPSCHAVFAWSAARPLAPTTAALLRLLRRYARPTDLEALREANRRWTRRARGAAATPTPGTAVGRSPSTLDTPHRT
ncbi:hypothetical protein LRS74_02170 [Streptomyces sp. LX-29]|uniref:hypothetical protein n=1 Tax=Streptomyces sp. LX-29 TaxID=2900152 RepID=UPI00240D7091|nr:hypothetical protein [Streptomyces sp. LX-29]WFB05970.1 hypothetical protein LRS74_02170 [Streptomyces sp. LX-29]